MGILTFQEINDQVRLHHANRADLTSAEVDRLIDLAQYRIARRHEWNEMKHTVIGNLTVQPTDTYADRRKDRIFQLTSDGDYQVKNFYGMKIRDSASGQMQKLTGLTHTVFDEQFPDPDYSSRYKPSFYTFFNTKLLSGDDTIQNAVELNVAPDLTYEYQARIQTYPRRITAGERVAGDTPDLLAHDDAIINLCVSMVYQRFGREDKAKEYFNIYSAMIQELIEEDNRRIHTTVSATVSTGGGPQYWRDPFVRSIR